MLSRPPHHDSFGDKMQETRVVAGRPWHHPQLHGVGWRAPAKPRPLLALAPEPACCPTFLCKEKRSMAEVCRDCAVTQGGG